MAATPNILLLVADQHRGDWLRRLGTLPVRTPNLDLLADAGTAFDAAVCASPLCAPSRAGLAMSRDYDRLPVRSNADDLPVDAPTFYRTLAAAGYRLSTCGKLDLFKAARSWGVDGLHRRPDGSSRLHDLGFSGGFDAGGKHDAVYALREGRPEPFTRFLQAHGLSGLHETDYRDRPTPSYANCRSTPLPVTAYGDNWIAATALELIGEAAAAAQPWFLQVNFFGPHEPMDVPQLLIDRWASVDFPVPDDGGATSPDQHREIRRRYAAMIENIDGWVGCFRSVLESLGVAENTIVVYASDHGDMLGEKGMWAKLSPFQGAVRVPLIMAGPGIAAGQVRKDPVSLIDLGPTLVDLAGIKAEAGKTDGVSLRRHLEGGAAEPGATRASGFGAWRTVTDGRHKIVAGFDRARLGKGVQAPTLDPRDLDDIRRVLLFDLKADPGETHDLAADLPGVAAGLLEKLHRHVMLER